MKNQFSDIKDLESKIKLSLEVKPSHSDKGLLDALLIIIDEIKDIKEEVHLIKYPLG